MPEQSHGQESAVLNLQSAILILQRYWSEQGCVIAQPYNTEVGAGTMNPATFLRVLGPEPWRVAYVEPSVRPDDSRYGDNPNRLQTHTQFQVILKPEPGNPQELYLGSLAALGIDIAAHDIRFVEDNWAQPAIGAWGLGWEVWLDGMEITQFTYFQQVGGLDLDPVSVEITYGLERILMSRQRVTHFKQIAVAEGLSYGEVWGESEYEMSRYYLDLADIEATRRLYETYLEEARHLISEGVPLAAYNFVLKSSHAFNVLDARGAMSTTERANAFASMRSLVRDVAKLWVEKRSEAGFPLLKPSTEPASEPEAPMEMPEVKDASRLVVEIGMEELPPQVVDATVDQVRDFLANQLDKARLPHGSIEVEGTPRRIVVFVDDVATSTESVTKVVRGPRFDDAYGNDGNPSKALQGFLRKWQKEESAIRKVDQQGVPFVALEVAEPVSSASKVISETVAALIRSLRAEKNMRWNNPELSFSRPIRWLTVLLGDQLIPVEVGNLRAGRATRLFHSLSQEEIPLEDGDDLLLLLKERGIIVSRQERRARIVELANEAARSLGAAIDPGEEASLIDEITNLCEAPNPILGSFDRSMLELPEPVLVSVMRKHQRYLPLRDSNGKLLPHFLTFADGPCDEALVREGNESVIRARFEDASFFFRSDLAVTPDDFARRLDKLTFDVRIGSVKERVARIGEIAGSVASKLDLTETERAALQRAKHLLKFDLATEMVIELPELSGIMAEVYALKAGEPQDVARALYEAEMPKNPADDVPSGLPGTILSVADRVEFLAAMFALGVKTSGSSDPLGLRRNAIGLIRTLTENEKVSNLALADLFEQAFSCLGDSGIPSKEGAFDAVMEFLSARFEQHLRSLGFRPELVAAFDATVPGRSFAFLREISENLEDGSIAAMARALRRAAQIVPEGHDAVFLASSFVDEAENALYRAIARATDPNGSSLTEWARDNVQLFGAIDDFFNSVLVMDENPEVRANRLGLLAKVLEIAPRGIRWKQLADVLDEISSPAQM
jgi:glycyl-tRNA synthetase